VGWVQEATLLGDGSVPDREFGTSVAISGEVIVVSAQCNPNDEESVYVFRWNGASWIQEAQLQDAVGDCNSAYGRALAIEQDVLLVGSSGYYNHVPQDRPGGVYFYRWNGSDWVLEQLVEGPVARQAFGYSVSLSGNVAFIGTTSYNDAAAYAYRWNGSQWVQESVINYDDVGAQQGSDFGSSVAVSGDLALVGAYAEDVDGQDRAGAAYVFRHGESGWSFETKITPYAPTLQHDFGFRISLSGGKALVGAPGGNVGAAWFFDFAPGGPGGGPVTRYVATTGVDAGNGCANVANPCATGARQSALSGFPNQLSYPGPLITGIGHPQIRHRLRPLDGPTLPRQLHPLVNHIPVR